MALGLYWMDNGTKTKRNHSIVFFASRFIIVSYNIENSLSLIELFFYVDKFQGFFSIFAQWNLIASFYCLDNKFFGKKHKEITDSKKERKYELTIDVSSTESMDEKEQITEEDPYFAEDFYFAVTL